LTGFLSWAKIDFWRNHFLVIEGSCPLFLTPLRLYPLLLRAQKEGVAEIKEGRGKRAERGKKAAE
jgi:hypothetical protein